MASAVAINVVTFHFIMKGSPLYAGSYCLNTKTRVDRDLILGATLFGLGWGLSGLCPGPAMISMFVFTHCIFYIAGLALGQILHDNGCFGAFRKEVSNASQPLL